MRRILPWTSTVAVAVMLMAMVFLPALEAGAGAKKKKPKPRPREEILKLFVEEFVPLTPGKGQFPASFEMGSKQGHANEQPMHKVTLKKPFSMARYEVTQELYEAVMGTNPSKWKGPRNAVEMVTWDEANAFCAKVTEELQKRKLLAKNEKIRLASEAEWEYACRAGTQSAYSFGDDLEELTKYCWYKGNSKGFDPPVGEKAANPWGFYDMHGYNWEWVADDYVATYKDGPANGQPQRAEGASEHVMRGGSWADPADAARSAFRGHLPTKTRNDKVGFRCVRATF